jgi:hypothetical protein
MSRVRGLAYAAAFFWAVAFLAAIWPVTAGDSYSSVSCGNAVGAVFRRAADVCVDRAAGRVGFLAVWLVLTGAVSTALLAYALLAGRDVRR